MKHNTNKKILVILAAVVFVFFAVGALAAQKGVFANDPRASSPSVNLRANPSSGTGFNAQPGQELLPENSQSFNQNNNSVAKNSSSDSGGILTAVLAVMAFVIIFFVALILFSLQGAYARDKK